MRIALVLLAVLGLAAPAHAQNSELRSFGYARLGYGGVFADPVRPAPAIGFGYRAELEKFALDVSFLNYTISNVSDPGKTVFAGSLLRLQALRFINSESDRSTYVGAGLSWGGTHVGRDATGAIYASGWYGTGLQSEVTVGYELPRSSSIRVFVQTDVGFPMYKVRSDTYTPFTYTPTGSGAVVQTPRIHEERWMPSAVVSMGVGWQRHP